MTTLTFVSSTSCRVIISDFWWIIPEGWVNFGHPGKSHSASISDTRKGSTFKMLKFAPAISRDVIIWPIPIRTMSHLNICCYYTRWDIIEWALYYIFWYDIYPSLKNGILADLQLIISQYARLSTACNVWQCGKPVKTRLDHADWAWWCSIKPSIIET